MLESMSENKTPHRNKSGRFVSPIPAMHTPRTAIGVAIAAIVLGLGGIAVFPNHPGVIVIICWICLLALGWLCWNDSRPVAVGLLRGSLDCGNVPSDFWIIAFLMIVVLGITGWISADFIEQSSAIDDNGAMISINPLPPVLLSNEKYNFPLLIKNVGNKKVNGYSFAFHLQTYDHVLSPEEENAFMKFPESELYNLNKFNPKIIENTGISDMDSGGLVVNQPRSFDKSFYDYILSGKIILYYGVSVIFADEISVKKDIPYFAEICIRFDPVSRNYLHCTSGHNSLKSLNIPH